MKVFHEFAVYAAGVVTFRFKQAADLLGQSARNRFTKVTRDAVMAQVELQAGPFRDLPFP